MDNSAVVDVCVVGAGVIGLAIARELAISGIDVLVLEQGPRFGEGISSRNSEVIHAGIYYPAGSLKAELCVRGRSLLYEYCESRRIGHDRVGKLIVATTENEELQLENIQRKAGDNGVDDLVEVSRHRLLEMEPALHATMALLSPSTGIVSASDLMTSLLADLESCGGTLATRSTVRSVEFGKSGFTVRCDIAKDHYDFQCERVVNAAGLGAQKLAASIEGCHKSLYRHFFFAREIISLIRAGHLLHI